MGERIQALNPIAQQSALNESPTALLQFVETSPKEISQETLRYTGSLALASIGLILIADGIASNNSAEIILGGLAIYASYQVLNGQ